jgi:hypothetical protein
MKDIKELIKRFVKETLDEMTSTSSVAGYSTPFAFSRGNKKNRATKYTEKLGFKVCSKNEEESEEQDILSEDVNYDSSKDLNNFRKSLSAAEVNLSQKFSASLKEKLLGKTIEIQGSKGYGQFKTKYSLRVMDVSVEDWYGKEDYQLIITGEDRKQYFVDVTVPIKIVDQKTVSVQPKKPVAPAQAGNQPTTVNNPPARPQSELDKAISK